MKRMVPGDVVILDGEGMLNATCDGFVSDEATYDVHHESVYLGAYEPMMVIAILPAKPIINESGDAVDRYKVLVMGFKTPRLGWGWNNWFTKEPHVRRIR